MSIYGKRNKYREVPLNSTAREALTSYVRTLPDGAGYLFPSRKRGDSSAGVGPVGERALIYIVSKYADQARVRDLSPHDLRHRFGYRMAQTVRSIAWPSLWGTTRWTPPFAMSVGPSRTCSKPLKPSRGHRRSPISGKAGPQPQVAVDRLNALEAGGEGQADVSLPWSRCTYDVASVDHPGKFSHA